MARTLVSKPLLEITISASPTPLSATSLVVPEFTVFGPSTNSGDFFIGDSTITSANGIARVKSVPVNFYPLDIAGQPKGYDLSKWYVIGTTGDKLRVQYAAFAD